MAIATGQNGVVKIGTSSSNEAAVGNVRSFSIETSADTIEKTVMGDVARSYLPSLATGTVSIEAYWDEADAPQLELDERATVFFEVYPTGTANTEEYYSGSGIVTSRSISAAFDGMVEASFTIQISGTTGSDGKVVTTTSP